MKKILCNILTFILVVVVLFGGVEPHYAATGVSLSTSASSIKIGEEVSVTVSIPSDYSATIDVVFPTNILQFQSASTKEVGQSQVSNGRVTVSLSGVLNLTSVTIKFKAISSGEAGVRAEVIKAGNTTTEESVQWDTVSKSVNVANQTSAPEGNGGGGSAEPQKSADNSLSSLKLSAGSLSPSFKPNTTKYTATVDYSVKSVVVSAQTSSSKAVIESVTGDGTVNLEVGKNTIEVIVRAENGVKAKYTIEVTRKAETDSTPQPSESESEEPVVNEVLQWNGEQLQPTKEIPKESIPADFETTSLVVNGQQMPGLSFGKGDLKLVYLNNTNGAGSLYVFDEAQQTIYPFIKLESEKSYVMVLLPNEQNEPVPEGFESCTFSIEGKGLVSAYQLSEGNSGSEEGVGSVEDSTSAWNIFGAETYYAADPKANEFYLIYCMNDVGEKGWYMYDSVEETFQRYFVLSPSVQAGADVDLESENAKLQKELNTAKTTQYIIIAIAAAVVLIMGVVLVVIILKNRPKDDFFDEYDDEYDDEFVQEEDIEEDDEDEEDVVAQAVKKIVEAESPKISDSTSVVDDGDFEFIDFD